MNVCYQDILNVKTLQLGTDHCNLNALIFLAKVNL